MGVNRQTSRACCCSMPLCKKRCSYWHQY